MKVSDIDAKITELQKKREIALQEEEEQKKREHLTEARETLGRLVNDLRRLNDIGYLPPRLREALTDEHGKVNPGLYVKRPRAPSDQDSSE